MDGILYLLGILSLPGYGSKTKSFPQRELLLTNEGMDIHQKPRG